MCCVFEHVVGIGAAGKSCPFELKNEVECIRIMMIIKIMIIVECYYVLYNSLFIICPFIETILFSIHKNLSYFTKCFGLVTEILNSNSSIYTGTLPSVFGFCALSYFMEKT